MAWWAQRVFFVGQLAAFVAGASLLAALEASLDAGALLGPLLVATAWLAALAGGARASESRLGPRAGAALALIAVATSVGVALACASALGEPIVRSSVRDHGASTARHAVNGFVAVTVFTMLGGRLALLVASSRQRAWAPALVRWGARAKFVGALVLTVLAAERASRLPSPDRYVGSLEVLARLPAQTDVARGALIPTSR